MVQTLEQHDALKYSVIVAATASEAAPLQYIAPFTACAIGEWFRDNGRHALIVYDDLSKQAVAYRQLSLLLRRPPGREAYPGDVFYLHSRLLERAAKMSDAYGGGSLTALPVIETQGGDVLLIFQLTLFPLLMVKFSWKLNYSTKVSDQLLTSVCPSPVSVLLLAMKQVAGSLKIVLGPIQRSCCFSIWFVPFGCFYQTNLVKMTIDIIETKHNPLAAEEQVPLIFAGVNGFLDNVALDRIGEFEEAFLGHLKSNETGILDAIKTGEF